MRGPTRLKHRHGNKVNSGVSQTVPTVDAIPDVLPLEPPPVLLDVLPLDQHPVVAPEILDVVPIEPPLLDVLPAPEAPPDVLPASEPLRRRGLLARICQGIYSAFEWLFGALTLTIGLAALAAVPVLGFFSLGYMLEAGGRIARTGKFRNGFPGVRKAARIGSIVIGAWVMLLPLRLASSYALSAQIIDPDGPIARLWRVGIAVLTVLMTLHIVTAIARGGKLRYFVWPFNFVWLAKRIVRGGFYSEARDRTYDFVVSLRLPYYFWLGLRGFVGAFIWLVIPITLLALGTRLPPVGFLGALLLSIVLLYVPFLQMEFAVQNRFRALFAFGTVRRNFKKAPYAFTFALFITLLFAVPLYLLKIEVVPREAAWLPALVFMIFIFPARLLAGWAYGLALHRPRPRHWFFRWTARIPVLPMAIFYVFILFFTQYTAWEGVISLYEQHAFLLPVPFMGS